MLDLFQEHGSKGLPVPTNAELRAVTGLSSTSTIFAHLRTLVSLGKLAQHRGKYYLVVEAPKDATQTAWQRASELFRTKGSLLPQRAIDYRQAYCLKYAACGEVIINAFAAYAHFEEGLEVGPKDEHIMDRPDSLGAPNGQG